MVNLQEAFSKLNIMESSDFELLDKDEKDAMKNFLEDDEIEAQDVEIIDPQADDEMDLQDSYVGKIIVQCPVCKSLIYKTQDEINEEGDEPQNCPYCFSVEKFDLIGKVVPIEDEMAPEAVEEEPAAPEAAEEPVMEGKKDVCPKCGQNPCVCEDKCNECGDQDLKEDLENITIETEDEVINISAEEKAEECPECAESEEMAEEPAPEADEHEEAEVIAPLDDDEEDSMEFDEVDEKSFDDFAESLLQSRYSNIVSYKTNKMTESKNSIIAEGYVQLKDGSQRLTEFKIVPKRKGSCLVENLQLGTKGMVKVFVK